MEKKCIASKWFLFVMAEDEGEACVAATGALRHLRLYGQESRIYRTGMDDAIPFNADDERTCAEIMSDKSPTALPETRLMKCPPM